MTFSVNTTQYQALVKHAAKNPQLIFCYSDFTVYQHWRSTARFAAALIYRTEETLKLNWDLRQTMWNEKGPKNKKAPLTKI